MNDAPSLASRQFSAGDRFRFPRSGDTLTVLSIEKAGCIGQRIKVQRAHAGEETPRPARVVNALDLALSLANGTVVAAV